MASPVSWVFMGGKPPKPPGPRYARSRWETADITAAVYPRAKRAPGGFGGLNLPIENTRDGCERPGHGRVHARRNPGQCITSDRLTSSDPMMAVPNQQRDTHPSPFPPAEPAKNLSSSSLTPLPPRAGGGPSHGSGSSPDAPQVRGQSPWTGGPSPCRPPGREGGRLDCRGDWGVLERGGSLGPAGPSTCRRRRRYLRLTLRSPFVVGGGEGGGVAFHPRSGVTSTAQTHTHL